MELLQTTTAPAKAPRKARATQTPKATKAKLAAKTSTLTREQWLVKAVNAMNTSILKPAGYAMPELWKVTCGFAKGSGKAIGQCWPPTRAADGKTTHMMVCPSLGKDPVRVLDIVLHEMGHAAVGCEHGHKKPFRDFVKAVGLGGKKVTATVAEPGTDLHAKLVKLAAKLGEYPHQALQPKQSTKKAAGGWLRLVSQNDETYKVVISPKSLDEHGAPMDPWGTVMVLVN